MTFVELHDIAIIMSFHDTSIILPTTVLTRGLVTLYNDVTLKQKNFTNF